MNITGTNVNGKIQFFVQDNIEVEVVDDSEEQVLLKLFLTDKNAHILISIIYAKYDKTERISLWDILF